MNTYTVYGVISDRGDFLYDLYMVPGDAKADYCNRTTRMQDWPDDGKIPDLDGYMVTMFLQKQKLFSDSSVEELFSERISVPVYAVWDEAVTHSNWYMSEEEAAASQEGQQILNAGGQVIERWLHQQKRFPVELPTTVTLEKGEKGLYAKLNLRPDLDGDVSGKFYFPDRSCESVAAGLFRVTSVKEHGTYGFLSGHMVTIKAPEEEELAEYLVERLEDTKDASLRFMSHPACGSFVELKERASFWRKDPVPDYLIKLDGKVQLFAALPYIYDIESAEVTETCLVKDFLCEGYHGCTYEELEGQLAYPDHLSPLINSIFLKSEPSPKFISNEFEKAAALGLVKLIRFQKIDFVYIGWGNLLKAAVAMTSDELWSMVDSTRDINDEASERLVSMIRKGKIRIS